jgi:hypothetical protein
VTLGGTGTAGGTSLQKAGTFMYELGFNLGLDRGGAEPVDRKPNYLSVMNTNFLFIGLLIPSGSHILREFNYSTRLLPPLNEKALVEGAGISDPDGHLTLWYSYPLTDCRAHPNDYFSRLAYPATDWNCNGALSPGTVQTDLNADVDRNQLNGFDDWSALSYDGHNQIGVGPRAPAGPSLLAPSDVMTTTLNEPTYQEIRDAVPPVLFNAEATAPIDVVSLSPASGYAPLPVMFNGAASTTPTGTVTSYAWDFGDTTVGTGATITHTYSMAGTYFATLRVTNSNGDVNLVALRHRVTVLELAKLFLPLVRR